MGFNEREAIKFRMEKIAEEKEKLYQRDQTLDGEYEFYIDRLRELDQNSPESVLVKETPRKKNQTNSNRELKNYDFDALKEGLNHFKKKPSEEKEEKKSIDSFMNVRNDRRRKGKQYNLKEVAAIAEDILKDSREPIRIRMLRDLLADRGYTWKHFLPTLPNIMRHSEHIEKPSRGMIAYVSSNGEDGITESVGVLTSTAPFEGLSEAASAEGVSGGQVSGTDDEAGN